MQERGFRAVGKRLIRAEAREFNSRKKNIFERPLYRDGYLVVFSDFSRSTRVPITKFRRSGIIPINP